MLPIITAQAIPGYTGVTLLARIVGGSGILITRATISALSCIITDVTKEAALAGSGAVATLTPAVSSSIYDALQQDAIWTKDSAAAPGSDGRYGYNFAFTVPAANFTSSGDRFQVDVVFTPVTGEPFRVPFVFSTLKVYG